MFRDARGRELARGEAPGTPMHKRPDQEYADGLVARLSTDANVSRSPISI